MKQLLILLVTALALTIALQLSAGAGVCVDDQCAPDSPVSPVSAPLHRIYLPLVAR